jgi:histidinol-phosphate aminotransferase
MNRDLDTLVRRLVRAEVRAAAPYHVQDARGLVKLDAMENPYAWPEELRRAMVERLAKVEPNRYPDPRAEGLRARLRTAFDIEARWDLLLGNGSDEIILMLLTALARPGLRVLAPAPTFVMFRVISQWLGAHYEEVPLAAGFALDLPGMLRAIEERPPQLVFLACPNNPTGNLFAERALRDLLEATDALVVIDEAYSAFSSRDHLPWLAAYPNLLVMRTLSKLGLAGLRLGFLVGDASWIRELDKVRLPYNVSTLNQAAAEAALENFPLLRAQAAQVLAERERLGAVLAADPRLECWPSETNFMLVRPRAAAAHAVHAGLLARGVLVKCLDGAHPQLANCLRLGIGTPAENTLMLAALDAALGAGAG